jgi:hypothetical protein
LFGSFLPGLLVGWHHQSLLGSREPTLSWNHYTHDAAFRFATTPRYSLISLIIVRMIWWFLIVAVAAGAVVWAVLSAYVRVRQRLNNAQNRPPEPDQPEPGHEL